MYPAINTPNQTRLLYFWRSLAIFGIGMSEIQEAPVSAVSAFSSKTPGLYGIRPLLYKYEIGELLGCGSFSKVYRARNIENGQNVAIKVINKNNLPTNSISISNIKREMSIMRRVRHPNIVRLYEVLATKTKIYFVMEFAEGGDLFRKISKGRFTEDHSRKCFQQLISAVGYCHLHAVYHRDLKPDNILLDENGDLKVSDFGLSATIDQVGNDGLLHTICCTPAYAAPEIFSRGGYDGAKTDVWSCGVILFALVAGYLPFMDRNLVAIYRKIYRGKYRCPEWLSPELKRLLSRLLDINPMTRITIDEIKRDPWFKEGFKENKYFYEEELSGDFNDKLVKNDQLMIHGPLSLNAFDLISFSPALDLSGFFDGSCGSMDNSVRLAVKESPKAIMERVLDLEMANEVENANLRRHKEWGVELHGHGASGKFIIGLEVFRLTADLLVVEAKRKSGPAGFFHELWEKKIMPAILSMSSQRVD